MTEELRKTLLDTLEPYTEEGKLKALKKEVTPVKSTDYFTPQEIEDITSDATLRATASDEKLLGLITPLIPEPIAGEDGKDGINGLDGKDGEHGVQGPKGDKGDIGEPGIQGLPGINGKDGEDAENIDIEKFIETVKEKKLLSASDLKDYETLIYAKGKKGMAMFQQHGAGVTKIIAGSGITISSGAPASNGLGDVTITATAQGTSIGGTVTGGTDGSVLFIHPDNTLAQDNANFFWDDTLNRLGIGTATPNNTIQVAGLINFNPTDFNTLLGQEAGANLAVGARNNVYIGYRAGKSSVTSTAAADQNVGIGSETLLANETGFQNLALGMSALTSNTSGNQNVAIGFNTLITNSVGDENVAIGYTALRVNLGGNQNVAIGSAALVLSTSGGANVAIGVSALGGITTGDSNIGLGANAGRFITGGVTKNETSGTSVYIGADTLALADGGANEIVIGYGAVGFGSNSVVLGNTSITKTILRKNVGIVETTPTAYLHLGAGTATAGTAPLKLNTGTALTAVEDGALEYHTSHLYFSIGAVRYQLDQQPGAAPHILLDGTYNSDTLSGNVLDGDVIIGNVTPKWSRLAISIPAANVRNVFGVDNGELRPSWKTALDATNPTTIGVGDVGGPGTSLIFSHRDHQHPSPATWTATAHNLLSAIHGDTTASAAVLGGLVYADATPKWVQLAGNTTTTKKFLRQTGDGAVSAAPAWDTIASGDLPVINGRLLARTVLTSGTSHTTNATTTKIFVELVGGGGGGGGATQGLGAMGVGAGGAAGGYANKLYTVTGSTAYTYAIGAAGAAGANTGGTGGTGGDSTFTDGTTLVTAKGGLGGVGMTTGSTQITALGGAGVIPTNGDINAAGAPGGWSLRISGTVGQSGSGASSKWGGGGNGTNGSGAGNDATGYGSGGGGAFATGAVGGNRAGGAGTQGAVIIWEFS